jgi:hypothetical protein
MGCIKHVLAIKSRRYRLFDITSKNKNWATPTTSLPGFYFGTSPRD